MGDDVMILDAFNVVYVWIGIQSTETERKASMETAIEFVELAPDGRPKDTPVWLLKAGEEPYVFTANFHGWDYTKRKVPVSFNSGLSSVREAIAQYNRKYTYPELSLFYFNYFFDAEIVSMSSWRRNIPRASTHPDWRST